MKTQTTAGEDHGGLLVPGGDDDGSRTEVPQWALLPDDLLAMVRGKATSPFDRARFTAVCRSWRAAAASRQPAALPSPLPLLLSVPSLPRCESCYSTENRLYCPEDGRNYAGLLLDVPLLQSKACRREIVGSHDGGWLAALFTTRPHAAAGYQQGTLLVIFNLFSRAEVALSPKQRDIAKLRVDGDRPLVVSKMVFSEDPASSGCVLAAMLGRCQVAVCRIGCPDQGWTVHKTCSSGSCLWDQLQDIVFFNGELYGLTQERLIKLNIGTRNQDGARPVVTTVHQLGPQISKQIGHGDDDNASNFFLVELRRKLAIAVSDHSLLLSCRLFEVGEAEDDYKYAEVTSLGNYTLFLGSRCSKALENSYGGFDHQYGMFHDICGVYSHWEDEDEITRNCVELGGAFYPRCDGTWLLPPELQQTTVNLCACA